MNELVDITEVKKRLKKQSDREAGILLLCDELESRRYYSSGAVNAILLGSDKLQVVQKSVLPMVDTCIKNRESFVVVEKDRYIYKYTSNNLNTSEENYNVFLLDFTNLEKSDGISLFNYLAYLEEMGEMQEANKMLEFIADTIIQEKNSNNKMLMNLLFEGVYNALRSIADKNQINLYSIYSFLSDLMKKDNEFFSSNLSEFLQTSKQKNECLEFFHDLPGDIQEGVVNKLKCVLLQIVKDQWLMKMLVDNQLKIEELSNMKPFAIYIINDNEKYAPVVSIVVNQLYQHLKYLAKTECNDGGLIKKTNFVYSNYDEYIACLPDMFVNNREVNFTNTLIVQNLSVLNSLYENRKWMLRENLDILICYALNDRFSAEQVSRYIGFSTRKGYLVEPQDIMAPKKDDDAFVVWVGKLVYTTNFPDYCMSNTLTKFKRSKIDRSCVKVNIFSLQNYTKDMRQHKKDQVMELLGQRIGHKISMLERESKQDKMYGHPHSLRIVDYQLDYKEEIIKKITSVLGCTEEEALQALSYDVEFEVPSKRKAKRLKKKLEENDLTWVVIYPI